MKRPLLLLALMLMIPAFADDAPQPQAPQWYEFCPAQYLKADFVEVPKAFNNGLLAASVFVPPAAFIAIPMAGHRNSKINAANLNNYWVARRQDFDKEVALCNASTSDKAMCFMQIRQMESQKTEALKQNEAMKQLTRATRAAAYRSFTCHSNGFGGSTCY